MSLGNAICPRGCHVTALVLNPDWITKNPENPVAEILLGFTLEAKLVSSKDLTQLHLKIPSLPFRKLAFTLDDRVCYLRHKLSIIFVVNSVMHITNATARKCNHEAIAAEKSVL